MPRKLKILLVEDDSVDAALIVRCLASAAPVILEAPQFEASQCTSLGDLKKSLEANDYDVVLLDLTLPDSNGLKTFLSFREICPRMPCVILSGSPIHNVALEAVRNGAQDFVPKSEMAGSTLIRAILFAIERQRFEARQDPAIPDTPDTPDTQGLPADGDADRLESQLYPLSTAQSFGRSAIAEAAPAVHNAWVKEFDEIMTLGLNYRVSKEHNRSELSARTRALANAVGEYRGGPPDIIAVYRSCVDLGTRAGHRRRAEFFADEANYVLIEVLGHLAAFYRAQCVGGRPSASEPDSS